MVGDSTTPFRTLKLKAQVTDLLGHSNVSNEKYIIIQNNATSLPSIGIINPQSGDTRSGVINVEMLAASGAAISKVELYLNNEIIGETTTAPYRVRWDATTSTSGPYTLIAKVFDSAGLVDTSSPIQIRIDPVLADNPPIVSIIQPAANAIVSGNIVATASAWDDKGITRLNFYVGHLGGGNLGQLVGTAYNAPYTISYNSAWLSPGIKYTLSAVAFDSLNQSTTTSIDMTISQTPPSTDLNPPTGLLATALSSSQINLLWSDNDSNESGFKIERSLSSSGPFSEISTVGANVLTYQNTGLATGTLYYYQVRAYNGAGNSGYSNQASAKTQVSPPPAGLPLAPMNLKAIVPKKGQSRIALYWTDASSNELGFNIERSSNGGAFQQVGSVGAGVTSFSQSLKSSGLVSGFTYTYRVNAYNSAGKSSYSNQVSALAR